MILFEKIKLPIDVIHQLLGGKPSAAKRGGLRLGHGKGASEIPNAQRNVRH